MVVVIIPSSDLSQEIFGIDILKALKTSLEHSHKYVLQLLDYIETRLSGLVKLAEITSKRSLFFLQQWHALIVHSLALLMTQNHTIYTITLPRK